MNDTLGWTCLGGLVGLLVGLFIVVNGGGFIATFLEIGNNAVNTKNNTDYIRVDMDAIAKDIAYIKAEYHRHHTGS
jgi:glutamate dehydrogenase/leucine dehydrogenase